MGRYAEEARNLRRIIQATASHIPDEDALLIPSVFDRWDGETEYPHGSITVDPNDGLLYKCIVGEGKTVSPNPTWIPSDSPSIWVRIDDPADEWPPWRQPVSTETAYAVGAKVTHNGQRWISKIPANTTEPGSDDRWWELAE